MQGVVYTNTVCMQIDLVNSTYAELVRSVRLVPDATDQRDDVTQLVPSDDGDYLYALTEQQVNDTANALTEQQVNDIANACIMYIIKTEDMTTHLTETKLKLLVSNRPNKLQRDHP